MSDRELLLRENAALKRQLAERSRLAEAEARYDAVFNTALNLMAICTVGGLVLDVNQTALDAAAMRIEGCVGRHLWETPWFAGNPVEAGKVEAAFVERRGQFFEYESRVRSPRGDWRHIQFTFRPVRAHVGGEVRFLVFEGRDVTKMRQAAQAAAADQLQPATKVPVPA